ncbi:MAG: hypothetical protein AAGI71_16695 [Bacteroidota bacterium]
MAKTTSKKRSSARSKRSGSARSSARRPSASSRPQPLYGRRNYTLMLIGVVLIVIGYAIMRIENEHLGVVSLYISPVLTIGGYALIGYALLVRPSSASKEQPKEAKVPAEQEGGA